MSISDVAAKFTAFDWVTVKVNGHNQKEILEAIKTFHKGKPLAIIAETIKGQGSKKMEGQHAWHHRSPTKEEYEEIMKELQ